MKMDYIKLFIDVANHGSFAAAANMHNLAPSSVSRNISTLEQELGIRLFTRTTRNMSLTEAGAIYLARVAPLFDELTKANEEARRVTDKPTGLLKLTTSVSFGQTCIVPLLNQFRQSFPELDLELICTERNVDLISERIDLAIRLAPAITGNLVISKLRNTHYKIVASPDYLKTAPALSSPNDLAQHSCVLFNLTEYKFKWLFKKKGNSQVTEVAVTGEVLLSPITCVRDAVVSHLGPTLLPDWLVQQDIKQGRLLDCFPAWQVTATDFETAAWFVYPSRDYLPLKVRVAIDFFRQHLRKD